MIFAHFAPWELPNNFTSLLERPAFLLSIKESHYKLEPAVFLEVASCVLRATHTHMIVM